MKRIPHKEFEVIHGVQKSADYLGMQKKLGRYYLKGFLQLLGKMSCPVGGRLLEIGCGPGYQTGEVARLFPRASIVALEPSQDMISVAQDYMREQGLETRVRFVQGNVENSSLIGVNSSFPYLYVQACKGTK